MPTTPIFHGETSPLNVARHELPSLLAERLPQQYRLAQGKLQKLATEAAEEETHIAWLRAVALAAGIDLETTPARARNVLGAQE